jgi:hypothetical protein
MMSKFYLIYQPTQPHHLQPCFNLFQVSQGAGWWWGHCCHCWRWVREQSGVVVVARGGVVVVVVIGGGGQGSRMVVGEG